MVESFFPLIKTPMRAKILASLRVGGPVKPWLCALLTFLCFSTYASANMGNDSPAEHLIRGTATGLTGSGLVLADNAGGTFPITHNGPFTIASRLPAGSAYHFAISSQPSVEICVISYDDGVVGDSDADIIVECFLPGPFTISVSVSGLTGAGLVLQDNGTSNLPILSNGTYTFSRKLPAGGSYDVTVFTQPTGQVCTVPSPIGKATSNVTVAVSCETIYTVSAAVSGLTATNVGLVLQDNNGSNLSIPSNGTYPFAITIAAGGTYDVTVLTQPSGETCTVPNPSGDANSNVTVTVTCSVNMWTWENGPEIGGQSGVYGTEGQAAPGNIPGGRYGASTWIDSSGNFWLFGGYGYDATGRINYLNDLWKFSAGQWTWIHGSNAIDEAGSYGTIGVGSGTNSPGARSYAVNWIDSSGNFWLFGGYGLDSAGNLQASALNDLWEYSAGNWIWQGGPVLGGQRGSYGVQGQGSSTNIPGGRYAASAAIDSTGNVWLFGGVAIDSAGSQGPINDLWKFSAGQWTWVSGANTIEQKGTYTGSGAVPGARDGQSGWIDSSGNFWIFAGNGADMNGSFGYLNDLWEFSAGQWTWLSGSNVINQPASYGVEGIANSTNVPGSREYSVGWLDKAGNFWTFGGEQVGDRELTDLWKYSAGQWTWINGLESTDTWGIYGTLQQGAAGDTPGSRQLATGWIDASGNLWLFGGFGWASSGFPDSLNDLWEYQP